MRPPTSMEPAVAERFRKLFRAGIRQYGLKPADFANHNHLDDWRIPRFNDERTIKCLCHGVGNERKRNVTKLYEHAFEVNRPLTADWAYRILCMMSTLEKVVAWRAARDPGEDDWLWNMDRARLDEPWGDPHPRVLDWGPAPIAIPDERSAARFAREIARVLTHQRNRLSQPWVKPADEDGVAAMLQTFFDDNRNEMASNFASWYAAVEHQYRVIANYSKSEITRMLIRDGRKSRIEDVPTGHPTLEIHFRWSRKMSEPAHVPNPAEIMYAFLTHDLEHEARDRHGS